MLGQLWARLRMEQWLPWYRMLLLEAWWRRALMTLVRMQQTLKPLVLQCLMWPRAWLLWSAWQHLMEPLAASLALDLLLMLVWLAQPFCLERLLLSKLLPALRPLFLQLHSLASEDLLP